MLTKLVPRWPIAQSRRARVRCCQISLGLFLGLLWFAVISHLSIHWRSNPEYHFAWAIPVLIGAILFTRWRRFDTQSADASRLPEYLTAGIAIACLLALVPLAIIARANPDWHLISCLITALACTLTILAFDTYSGKSFRLQFGLPFLIMFAATPWPYAIESGLVNILKSANAVTTLEILHLFGVSALRESPHVIQLANAQLGIEDGCSGIRSLHLFLALTLFWGELYRLSIRHRLLLVALGLLLTLVTNLGRTLVLATLATTGGSARFDQWHNLVGTVAQLAAVAACCVALNWVLTRKRPRQRRHQQAASMRRFRSDRRGTVVFASASLWLIIASIGTAAWFKIRPQTIATDPSWSLRWPPPLYDCRVESIPGNWAKMMSPDESFSGSWRNQDGRRRVVYYFRWEPGNRAARLGSTHNPELCLSAGTGYTLKGIQSVKVEFAGRERAFSRYRFEFRGRDVFIFQGVWEDSIFADHPQRTPDQIGTRAERLRRAWHGLPHPGQRMLEIVLWDTSSADEAVQELEHSLKSLVASELP